MKLFFNYIGTHSSLNFKEDLERLKYWNFLKTVGLSKLYCILFYNITMRSWGQRIKNVWFNPICLCVKEWNIMVSFSCPLGTP